jgi:Carbonic anhydrase
MKVTLMLLVCSLVAGAASAQCPPTPPFAYTGFMEPDQWEYLAGSGACGRGTRQSPITLHPEPGPGNAVRVLWSSQRAIVKNSSYDFRVAASGSVIYEGTTYYLTNFHFHAPAEHVLGDTHFAAEAHFVHETATNPKQILVITFLFDDKSAPDARFRPVFDALSPDLCQEKSNGQSIDLRELLPESVVRYITYEGSLTTPPCTENVRFVIIPEPLGISVDDVRKLNVFGDNNRPLQDAKGREVKLVNAVQR